MSVTTTRTKLSLSLSPCVRNKYVWRSNEEERWQCEFCLDVQFVDAWRQCWSNLVQTPSEHHCLTPGKRRTWPNDRRCQRSNNMRIRVRMKITTVVDIPMVFIWSYQSKSCAIATCQQCVFFQLSEFQGEEDRRKYWHCFFDVRFLFSRLWAQD